MSSATMRVESCWKTEAVKMAEKLLDSGPMGKVVKTYLILVDKATKRQTIRFGDLAKEIGVVPQG